MMVTVRPPDSRYLGKIAQRFGDQPLAANPRSQDQRCHRGSLDAMALAFVVLWVGLGILVLR
jgi:hypothetical protein